MTCCTGVICDGEADVAIEGEESLVDGVVVFDPIGQLLVATSNVGMVTEVGAVTGVEAGEIDKVTAVGSSGSGAKANGYAELLISMRSESNGSSTSTWDGSTMRTSC